MESKVYQKPIVILEDDEGLAFLITEKIKEIYLPVISFQTASKAIDWLENNRNQAKFMMIDFSLPDMNAIGFLNCLKEKNIPIPRFVVVTGYGGEQIAVELMKLGAEDYFVKNSQFLESIPKIIKTQLKSIEIQEELEKSKIIIAEKQELLEQAQSIAHIGSWRFDINFENIICSNEIYNIFELDINEPLSYQKLISCIHEEDKQNVINTHLSAITNKTNYSIKYRIKKNEDNIKYVNEIGRFNKAENIDFLSGTVQDITEFTQMQEQLIHSEKLSVTGQLAAGIAHEFNNILSILKSNIQYLEMKLSKNNAEQEIVELYKIFIEQIDRAANIVKQLMLFSRPKPPQKKNVNVNEVIEEILKLQNKQLEFENIKISKQYSNDDVYICCDDGQLQQVLMNLIINARHAILAASKNNGEIKIIIEKINGKVIIKIIDNGIGIPQNVQDKIFTPFFSTKGAYIKDINQPKIKGTGLGLAISKKIIENNDGKISFVSKENVGTEFILEFNALLENKDNLPQKKNITKKDDLPNNTPILFIDDEQTLLQLISKNLKNKGYTNIYIATNADIATVLVKTINFKFIFLDIMMPFVDGYKLLKKLQNINAESDYYFMTGNLDVDVSMIDEYKVQGILQKPIDIEKIIEIINSKK